MGFVIILLTLAMVVDSLLLIGLVLIQLPKKDTGGGLAFGGGTSDALFGAGSGNVLTKVTKYAAIGFIALAILLSILQKNYHSRTAASFGAKLSQPAPLSAPSQLPESTAPAPATAPAANSNILLSIPPTMTNAAPATTTPAPAPAASTNAAPK